jgi:hypothetical protein
MSKIASTSQKFAAADATQIGLFLAALLAALKVTKPIKPYWTVPGTTSTVYDFAKARGISKEQVDQHKTPRGYIVAHLPQRTAVVGAPNTVVQTLAKLGL